LRVDGSTVCRERALIPLISRLGDSAQPSMVQLCRFERRMALGELSASCTCERLSIAPKPGFALRHSCR
jgi:hypothetical protein